MSGRTDTYYGPEFRKNLIGHSREAESIFLAEFGDAVTRSQKLSCAHDFVVFADWLNWEYGFTATIIGESREIAVAYCRRLGVSVNFSPPPVENPYRSENITWLPSIQARLHPESNQRLAPNAVPRNYYFEERQRRATYEQQWSRPSPK